MLQDYIILSEFLVTHGDELVRSPWSGNLNTLSFVFSSYCKKHGHCWKHSVQNFLDLLESFNKVSNGALDLRKTFISPNLELTYINKLKVEMVKRHSGPKNVVSNVSQTPLERLPPSQKRIKEILGLSLPEPSDPGLSLIDGDPRRLWDILERPTAMEVLAIERARQTTVRKAFYEACDDATHCQILAKICLGSKLFGSSMSDLPSNVKMRKVITNSRSQIPKGVYSCQKGKIHYLPLVTNSTDPTLGNCSYLDTCHKLKSCRYLHFYTLNPLQQEDDKQPTEVDQLAINYTLGEPGVLLPQTPPQWINCDVRQLPFPILGKFAAIISDPAWDIHMALPYGTCKDAELLSLPMNELQDEGILFLWVTGRSIEIGRKALAQWGYTISDEMIWVKLNQLRRTIVTGRTGHWLNHSKENLIVGIKGNPIWLNRKIDLDYIVSGTRETSRKPDELYDIVERLVGKHARKLEIFGRDHNIRPGWFTIGVQLTGTSIHEKEVAQAYRKYMMEQEAVS